MNEKTGNQDPGRITTPRETGVVHGRFQVLHNDHMEYLLAGMKRCRHLVIGISNPSPMESAFDAISPHRTFPASNPLSYYERMQMIKAAMRESGVHESTYDIVPFPIDYPSEIQNYSPTNAVYFLTIYDDWGEKKLNTLQNLHLQVEVLWKCPLTQKKISSTEIRARIAADQPWGHLVPNAVYQYIRSHHLDRRIKAIYAGISPNEAGSAQCRSRDSDPAL